MSRPALRTLLRTTADSDFALFLFVLPHFCSPIARLILTSASDVALCASCAVRSASSAQRSCSRRSTAARRARSARCTSGAAWRSAAASSTCWRKKRFGALGAVARVARRRAVARRTARTDVAERRLFTYYAQRIVHSSTLFYFSFFFFFFFHKNTTIWNRLDHNRPPFSNTKFLILISIKPISHIHHSSSY